MRLPQLLSDTLARPEVLWAAIAALTGLVGLWVAIRTPGVEARRTRKLREEEARVVLPAFLNELRETAGQAQAASELVRSHMAGSLHPTGGSAAQAGAWVRRIAPQTRAKLVRLAAFTFPIYAAYQVRIGDLCHEEASKLAEAYALLLSASARMQAATDGWLEAEGLLVDAMRNYGAEADAIYTVSHRCAGVLSERAGSRWLSRKAIGGH